MCPRTILSTVSSTTQTLTQPLKVNVPRVEEVREPYLEIREVGTGEVITVIEILSPKNKRPGEGKQPQDDPPIGNLHEILGQVYQEAALDLAINFDYSQQPVPPVSTEEFQWIQAHV